MEKGEKVIDIMPNEAERSSNEETGEAKGQDVNTDAGRIGLEPAGVFLRNWGNPSLPIREEVEKHRMQGHVIYRNWCPECVKARGKEMDHRRGKGVPGRFQNTTGTIVSAGMNWGSSGQY